jgi:membrane-associated protein
MLDRADHRAGGEAASVPSVLLLGLPWNLEEIIRAVGYPGLFAIVFAESGLLIGAFLPGDSLLFTAGFLASQGIFNLWALVAIFIVAAITGDAAGYSIGRRYGRRLFQRPDSRFFKRHHLVAAEKFYEKHGGKTIVLARFTPIVRTFAPIVAGMSDMPYRRFAFFNVFGALLWGGGVTIAGYYLGKTIPNPDTYILPVTFLIIIVSLLPTVLHLAHEHRAELGYLFRHRRWPARVAASEPAPEPQLAGEPDRVRGR